MLAAKLVAASSLDAVCWSRLVGRRPDRSWSSRDRSAAASALSASPNTIALRYPWESIGRVSRSRWDAICSMPCAHSAGVDARRTPDTASLITAHVSGGHQVGDIARDFCGARHAQRGFCRLEQTQISNQCAPDRWVEFGHDCSQPLAINFDEPSFDREIRITARANDVHQRAPSRSMYASTSASMSDSSCALRPRNGRAGSPG